MSRFIIITDLDKQKRYININHIIEFHSSNVNSTGNSIVRIVGETIQSPMTPEEIANLIKE